MAVAMIGGLTLATFATLLVAPALYALAFPQRPCRVRAAGAGEASPRREPGAVPAFSA
jgi:hypothetical protein